jgi:DNA-binding NarL/FixJ family response regulator
VLVLTSTDEYDLIRRALAAGAEDYLLKNSSADDLVAAIRVSRGGRPMPAPKSVADKARATHAHEA